MTCIPDVPSSLPVGTPFGPECEERPLAWLHGTTRTAKRVSPEKGGGKEHPFPSLLSCVYNFLALFITPRYAYLLLVIVGSLRKRLNQCSAVPGEETFNPLYAPSGLPFKLLHRRYLSLEGDSMAVFPGKESVILPQCSHKMGTFHSCRCGRIGTGHSEAPIPPLYFHLAFHGARLASCCRDSTREKASGLGCCW